MRGLKSFVLRFGVFLRSKSFREKINRLEIVLITLLYYWRVPLSTHLSRIYLYRLIFICDHLWESILFTRISSYDHLCESTFLSVYENKLVYEYHHFKKNLLSSKRDNNICWVCMFQFYVFLLWIRLILCLTTFLLNKVLLNSLNSVTMFIPFAVLNYLPSIIFIEYIFDFNPTNSSFIFPSDASFISPVTCLLARLKNLENKCFCMGFCKTQKLLKSNKCLCLKYSS